MGVVSELAKAFISRHKQGGTYERHQIIQRDLKGVRLRMMKKLVHYFYHKDKRVSVRTRDRLYLWKLVAWAIIERSKNGIDEQGLATLLKHRSDVIAKGPQPEANLPPSPVSGQQRSRRRERDNQMASKKKEKDNGEKTGKTSKKKVRVLGKTYEADHKFALKKNAENHSKFRKRGRAHVAAMLFKGEGSTYAGAVKALIKELTDGELEGTVRKARIETVARKTVRAGLRRLTKFNLLEGTPGTIKAKEEKVSKKKAKAEKKKGGKRRAEAEDEEDEEDGEEEEDDEDEAPRKKKKVVKAKKKAKAKAEEEDDEDDEEEDDEEDEEDEEEEDDD